MNKVILILSLLIFIPGFQANSQEWAPDGAEWYYDYENFWYTGYVHITVLGDTVIHDTTCRVLRRESVIHNLEFGTTSTYYNGRSYMFSDADHVYLFGNNKFYVLYDFTAVPGDSIVIPENISLPQVGCDPEGMVVVIDTGTININDQQFRRITVQPTEESHWALYGHIVPTLGPLLFYMLPEPNWCVIDLFEGGPLRCYSDPEFGLFNTGMAPECDYLVSVPEFEEETIKVYPNPCSDVLNIHIFSVGDISTFSVYNTSGIEVLSGNIGTGLSKLEMTHLPAGVYALVIRIDKKTYREKVVIK